jgi:hypothetical protein
MTYSPALATVVFPAHDLQAGIAAWSTVFSAGPIFAGDDFAAFRNDQLEIGLTALPWVDEPLVMLATDDLVETRDELLKSGATAMAEIAGGGIAELGTAPVTNGDPETGIVDAPGARLAVIRLADGSLVALRQSVEVSW